MKSAPSFPLLPAEKLSYKPASTLTTCPYCGVGCGVRATLHSDGQVDIAGDESHASNYGRLCVKGSALGETVDLDGRLLYPKMRVEADASQPLQRVSWDAALDQVAHGFRSIIEQHGPDSVALYVSGQLLTEDYYIANKLMKGYIGSANIDTNSRLCMSSAVAGHKRAFGADLVPVCYEDLELADLVVLVGSNTAWCHPILFQRIARIRETRPQMKLVVIDPRRVLRDEEVVPERRDAAVVRELFAAVVRLGAVGEDLDEHDGVDDGVGVLRVALKWAADDADVRVGG